MVSVNNVLDTSELQQMDEVAGLIHVVPHKCCRKMVHVKLVLYTVNHKVMAPGVVLTLVRNDRS